MREREEKKAKATSAKEKKREFALFCLGGDVCTYVCMSVFMYFCMYIQYVHMCVGGVCMCVGT